MFLLALAALVLAGCSAMQAYPGEKLPREQVAAIERQLPIFRAYYGLTLTIVEIDGLKPKGHEPEIEVLPGDHRLKLSGHISFHILATPLVLAKKPGFWPDQITFRAEAGRTYRLAVEEVEAAAFVVRVEDDQGNFAGGLKPEPPLRPK